MHLSRKHSYKRWEVSLLAIQDNEDVFFKVTRRIADLHVAETRIFHSKEEALRQFDEWLHE